MMPGYEQPGKMHERTIWSKSEKEFIQMEAIIQSMTREERENPSIAQCQQKKADRSRIGSAGHLRSISW